MSMTEIEAIERLQCMRLFMGIEDKRNESKFLEDDYVANKMAIKALEEIQQYRAIGTIEEFKALKEKNEPKKLTPIDYEKYIGIVENAKFLRGACWCPNCKHTVRSGTYCDDCGQKLDWSE
jgi:hypothetical protein